MAVEHQKDSQILLEQIMPQIAAQLRGAMGNIHTALTRLVPEEMPEGEGSTGQSAAILCQSYYRLLRLGAVHQLRQPLKQSRWRRRMWSWWRG